MNLDKLCVVHPFSNYIIAHRHYVPVYVHSEKDKDKKIILSIDGPRSSLCRILACISLVFAIIWLASWATNSNITTFSFMFPFFFFSSATWGWFPRIWMSLELLNQLIRWMKLWGQLILVLIRPSLSLHVTHDSYMYYSRGEVHTCHNAYSMCSHTWKHNMILWHHAKWSLHAYTLHMMTQYKIPKHTHDSSHAYFIKYQSNTPPVPTYRHIPLHTLLGRAPRLWQYTSRSILAAIEYSRTSHMLRAPTQHFVNLYTYSRFLYLW